MDRPRVFLNDDGEADCRHPVCTSPGCPVDDHRSCRHDPEDLCRRMRERLARIARDNRCFRG